MATYEEIKKRVKERMAANTGSSSTSGGSGSGGRSYEEIKNEVRERLIAEGWTPTPQRKSTNKVKVPRTTSAFVRDVEKNRSSGSGKVARSSNDTEETAYSERPGRERFEDLLNNTLEKLSTPREKRSTASAFAVDTERTKGEANAARLSSALTNGASALDAAEELFGTAWELAASRENRLLSNSNQLWRMNEASKDNMPSAAREAVERVQSEVGRIEDEGTPVLNLIESMLASDDYLTEAAAYNAAADRLEAMTGTQYNRTLLDSMAELERLESTAANDPDYAQTVFRGRTNADNSRVRLTTGNTDEYFQRLSGNRVIELEPYVEGFRRRYEASSRGAQAGNAIASDTEIFNLMDDRQKAVYDYYVGRGEPETAERYLDLIRPQLNYQIGEQLAAERNEWSDWDPRNLGLSTLSGLESSLGGIRNAARAVTGNDLLPQSSLATSQGLREYDSGVGQVINDLLNTTGYMVPAYAFGGTVGNVVLGVSSAGNAYQEAVESGEDETAAVGYAILSGMTESATNALFGGIERLGAATNLTGRISGAIQTGVRKLIQNPTARAAMSTLSRYLSSAAGEGAEEFLQEYIDAGLNAVFFGTEYDGGELFSDALYSALLGGLNAAVLNAPTLPSTFQQERESERFQQVADYLESTLVRGQEDGQTEAESEPDTLTVGEAREAAQEVQAEPSLQPETASQDPLRAAAEEVAAEQMARQEAAQEAEISVQAAARTLAEERAAREAQTVQAAVRTPVRQEAAEPTTAAPTQRRAQETQLAEAPAVSAEVSEARPVETPQAAARESALQGIRDAARTGLDYEQATSGIAAQTLLTAEEREQAWTEGYRDTRVGLNYRTSRNAVRNAVEQRLRAENNYSAENLREAYALAYGQFDLLGQIAQEYGIKIKVVDSIEARGRTSGADAAFNPVTGEIEIAADTTAGAYLAVGAHELTHYIKGYSASGYQLLEDVVLGALRAGGTDLDALIQRELNAFSEQEKQRLGTEEAAAAAREEVVANAIPAVFTQQDAVERIVNTDRTLAQRIVDFFRNLAQKLRGFLERLSAKEKQYSAAQELAQMEERLTEVAETFHVALQEASLMAARQQTEQLENGTETDGVQDGFETVYSIRYDVNGRPFVVVEEDILNGVPRRNWVETVKKVLADRFPDGVKIGNNLIKINSKTRREMTYSEYTKWLGEHDRRIYADKFRAAGYADEIILASREYINEGLKHARKDSIKDFARGTVLLRVGNSDYEADVVVGTTKSEEMLLYDIVNLQRIQINEKSRRAIQPTQSESRRSGTSAIENVSQDPPGVKNSIRENAGNDAAETDGVQRKKDRRKTERLKDSDSEQKKFSLRAEAKNTGPAQSGSDTDAEVLHEENVNRTLGEFSRANALEERQVLSERYTELKNEERSFEKEYRDSRKPLVDQLDKLKDEGKGKTAEAKEIQDKLESLRQEAKQRREAIASEMKKLREKYRQLSSENIAMSLERRKVREEARLAIRNQRERMEERQRVERYRRNIQRNANTLYNWVARPTRDKHVPEALCNATIEFLQTLDFTSGQGPSRRSEAWREKLVNLSAAIRANGAEGNLFADADPNLLPNIEELLRRGKGATTVWQMSAADLEILDKIVAAAKHQITTANQLMQNELRQNAAELGEQAIAEMDRRKEARVYNKGTRASLQRFLKWNLIDANTAGHVMGSAVESVVQELRNGFDVRIDDIDQAKTFVEDIFAAYKKDSKKDIRKEAAELHSFEIGGQKVELTTGEIMKLYTLSKRAQALPHLYEGGFRTTRSDNKGRRMTRPVRLNEESLKTITDALTPAQKRVADALQRFQSTTMADWGNEASLQRFGYRIFTEEFYSSISSDSNFLSSSGNEIDEGGNLNAGYYAIANLGMTKQTQPNANNPVTVPDIFTDFLNHVDKMSAYHAYLVPLADAMRVFNYKASDDSGRRSVRQSMDRAFGPQGWQYLSRLIKRLNGMDQRERSSGLMRNARVASVAANLSVIVQQPTAIVRAASILDGKYVSAALATAIPTLRKYRNLAQQYAPIAKWKSWGFLDAGLGPSLRSVVMGDASVREKIQNAATAPAGAADDVSWGVIFHACVMQIKAGNKSANLTQEEIYREAGKLFSRVIDETQVVDSPFHRAPFLDNQVYNTLLPFRSEPLKSYSMFVRKWDDVRTGKERSKRRYARTATAWFLSNVLASAFSTAVQTFVRGSGDEEDEEGNRLTDLERWLNNFLGDWSSWMPHSMIPVLSDAFDYAISGWGASRLDTKGIEGLVDVGAELIKVFNGESKKSPYGLFRDAAEAFSYLSGIPLYAAMRDIGEPAWRLIDPDGTLLDRQAITASSTDTYQALFEAYMTGDRATVESLTETLLAGTPILKAKDQDTVNMELAKRLMETDDPALHAALDARLQGDVVEMRKQLKKFTDLGFSLDVLTRTLNRMEDKREEAVELLAGEEETETESKPAALYEADDMFAAIRNNNMVGAAEIKDYLVDRSEAKDPEQAVKNTLTGEFKEEYVELYLSGEYEAARAISGPLEALDIGFDEDVFKEWVRDELAVRTDAALAERDVEQAQVLIEQQYSAGREAGGMKSSLTSKAKKRVAGYFEAENFVAIEDAWADLTRLELWKSDDDHSFEQYYDDFDKVIEWVDGYVEDCVEDLAGAGDMAGLDELTRKLSDFDAFFGVDRNAYQYVDDLFQAYIDKQEASVWLG